MASWHQGKLFIEHAVSISHDSLHVIIGVLLWLVLALLTAPAADLLDAVVVGARVHPVE